MIPDELIEQIRDSADLVEIIGEAVQLKRTGADYRGCCPFHGGTHRNFAVIPKKGMYYCYVCHEAGDVFTYLMKRQGMDYPTAVREIARRVGIAVPDRGNREGPDPREPLFTAMAAAQEWFATRLREDPEAAGARAYLAGRNIPPEAAGEQGLGYAPRGPGLLEAMKTLGIEERVMLEVRLAGKRPDGTIGPQFWSRLIFPIRDLRGRTVAFGGRLLGKGEPKYLNSPESPIYHKGAMLYNLHAAKQAVRREEQVILVEGYFDVIRLVLAGIDNVVAPLGTALTADQAALLRRFAPLAVLLYDSDPAGLKATFRAADECLRHKLRVKVATLPEGEDPDTLVAKGGSAALEPILHDAVDVIDRKIQILERKGWFEGLEHRRDALDGLLKTVRVTADPIARDLYLQRVSERTGVSRAVLEQELAARPAPPPAPTEPRNRAAAAGARPAPSASHRQNPGSRFESQVLESMLIAPEWRSRAAADLMPSHFTVPTFRRIFESLIALPDNAPVSSAADGLDPRGQDAWQRLAESADSQQAAGINFDAIYAGAVDELRRRAQPLPPVSDIPARRASLNALPPEARQRFSFRKEAEKARRGSTERSGPDHSQHS